MRVNSLFSALVLLWGFKCDAQVVRVSAPDNITWCETSCDALCMGADCVEQFSDPVRFANTPCVAGGCECGVGFREADVETGRVYDPCLEYGGCVWRDSLYSECRVQKSKSGAATVECFSPACSALDILLRTGGSGGWVQKDEVSFGSCGVCAVFQFRLTLPCVLCRSAVFLRSRESL